MLTIKLYFMKKITFLLLLLFTCLSYGQTCSEIFEVEGDDDTPMVLTVNASDLVCAMGTVNSITITDAILDDYWAYMFGETYCNEYYSFELNIDGEISSVCAEDLIGMEITNFTTLTITSADIDDYPDSVYMGVLIQINYTATEAPNCDAELTTPASGASANLSGNLVWTPATGAVVNYLLKVGTTSGASDVVEIELEGNVTNYDIPGILEEETEYFVNIIPSNSIGSATGCVEYSFTTGVATPGDFCSNVIDLTNETSPLSSTTVGALNDNLTVCGASGQVANSQGDLYYSILVPSGSMLTIGQTVNDYDSANVIFYGDCENRTSIDCFDDDDYKVIEWANETGEDQTVYWVQDGWSGTGTFTLAWSVFACTPSEATYTVVSNCDEEEQFLVNVDVTNLGSATSVSVSDNQGSNVQVLTAVGIATFGPYPNNTPVIFTVVNDQDNNCTLTSPTMNQLVCPPLNTTCATAIDLTNETSPLSSTTVGSTNTNLFVCNGSGQQVANTHADVYYSIVVPDGSMLTIGQTLNDYDSANVVFYGDCDNRTSIDCFDDSDYKQVQWVNSTGSDQTVYWIQDGWSGNGPFTLAWSVIACTPAEATYRVVSNCEAGEEFMVEVDVTNLGSATSVSVSDDQESETQVLTAIGVATFGPYANGTPVIFTVVNDQDDNCTLTSPAMNQVACPPANDVCISAVELTVGATFTDNEIVGTNLGATKDSADPIPACEAYEFVNNGKDVWFSFVVPASGEITVETKTNTGTTLTDTGLAVYSGECGSIVSLGCNADDGDGNFSKLSLANLTAGDELLVRVWGYNGASGEFKVSAYDASLSSSQFDLANFKLYPNPVKDVLNLSYTQNISNVQVFNMLGQQVITKSVDATQGQVDMSNLATGTYLVKVATDNQVKTIKVVKQ